MDELKNLAKHLRSIHLVFVLAAAAIVVALLGSNTVYDVAQLQLRDVVQLNSDLTADRITASIAESGGSPGRPTDERGSGRLEPFVQKALLAYFEATELYLDSVEVAFFSVALRADQYGRIVDIWDDKGFSWFENHLCLLTDGETVYTEARPLVHGSRRTIGDYRSFIDRMASVDALFCKPSFHFSYLQSVSVSERYPGLPEEIREALKEMNDVRLSVTVQDVALTNSESRNVFDRAQAHAEEDPIAYEDYNFEFDVLKLEVRARRGGVSGASGEALSFNLDLPIMFRAAQPQFVAQALQQTVSDSRYYARYLSGARSFERLFHELNNLIGPLTSVTPEDLERYLEAQKQKGGAPISLLGLQISRDLIEVWGVLLMLCVQLYFCMHYNALIDRLPKDRELVFPWIGLYQQAVPTVVFHVSVALPLAVASFVALRQAHAGVLGILAVAVAAALLVWIEVLYLRYRVKAVSD